ncbi:MAG: 23S rRNA (pseudouridine(1915)-N(3))-methyltransferase RlmH [Thermoanaerobaculaceae bacterium]|jgi:23S rRNA (pseudouridine1915-N3)-methyltransferase
MAPRQLSRVLLVWVGRRAPEPLEALTEVYARRVARFFPFSEVRVPPAEGRAGDPHRALAREAAAIRKHLEPSDTLVALDERGRERTTAELARWLDERSQTGRTAFVIGSDLGLDEELKAAAQERLALSRLTLPHHLVRLLLLEQLYRASDLLAGGQYHRGGLG